MATLHIMFAMCCGVAPQLFSCFRSALVECEGKYGLNSLNGKTLWQLPITAAYRGPIIRFPLPFIPHHSTISTLYIRFTVWSWESESGSKSESQLLLQLTMIAVRNALRIRDTEKLQHWIPNLFVDYVFVTLITLE